MKQTRVSHITKEGIIEIKEGLQKKKRTKMSSDISLTDGTAIAVPLFLFILVGSILDGYFKTKYCVLLGIIIGAIATIYNLFRLVKKSNATY